MSEAFVRAGVPLVQMTALELLRSFAAVLDELTRRGLVRTINNPVSDYTEWLVSSKLGLELRGNSRAGYDARGPDGAKYQIKGRRARPGTKAVQLSAIRNLNSRPFDFLVAVVFEPDFSIRHAVRIPYEVVAEKARYQAHTNSHIFHVRPALLSDTRVEDLRGTLAV